MFKLKDFIFLGVIILFYLSFLFIFKNNIFSYQFSPEIVGRYFRSQDIEGEVENRIFVSDEEIYIASGYLYAQGIPPDKYNFQHPPFIKYLFGWAINLWGNPYIVQLIFGVFLLTLTYLLGITLFSQRTIAFLATLFLLIDPIFINLSSEALLDLGQTVFALIYLLIIISKPKWIILPGITLGLFAASKFWTVSIFWFVTILLFEVYILKRKLKLKQIGGILITALITFSLTYFRSFTQNNLNFNLIALEGKTIKFMLSHNSALSLGGNLILFVSGYFVKWWDKTALVKGDSWSILWPVSLIANIYSLIKPKFTKKQFIIYLFPLAYLIFTITQVPFSRYFILFLPLLYLILSKSIINFINRISFFKSIPLLAKK